MVGAEVIDSMGRCVKNIAPLVAIQFKSRFLWISILDDGCWKSLDLVSLYCMVTWQTLIGQLIVIVDQIPRRISIHVQKILHIGRTHSHSSLLLLIIISGSFLNWSKIYANGCLQSMVLNITKLCNLHIVMHVGNWVVNTSVFRGIWWQVSQHLILWS